MQPLLNDEVVAVAQPNERMGRKTFDITLTKELAELLQRYNTREPVDAGMQCTINCPTKYEDAYAVFADAPDEVGWSDRDVDLLGQPVFWLSNPTDTVCESGWDIELIRVTNVHDNGSVLCIKNYIFVDDFDDGVLPVVIKIIDAPSGYLTVTSDICYVERNIIFASFSRLWKKVTSFFG
jgi:hypothetical protein